MLSVYSTKYLNETGVFFVAFSHLYVQHVVEANRKNSRRIIERTKPLVTLFLRCLLVLVSFKLLCISLQSQVLDLEDTEFEVQILTTVCVYPVPILTTVCVYSVPLPEQ